MCSSCYSRSIELHSAGVALRGNVGSSVHGCWNLLGHETEWMGFHADVNPRLEPTPRCVAYLVILLIVGLHCEQGAQSSNERVGTVSGGVTFHLSIH